MVQELQDICLKTPGKLALKTPFDLKWILLAVRGPVMFCQVPRSRWCASPNCHFSWYKLSKFCSPEILRSGGSNHQAGCCPNVSQDALDLLSSWVMLSLAAPPAQETVHRIQQISAGATTMEVGGAKTCWKLLLQAELTAIDYCTCDFHQSSLLLVYLGLILPWHCTVYLEIQNESGSHLFAAPNRLPFLALPSFLRPWAAILGGSKYFRASQLFFLAPSFVQMSKASVLYSRGPMTLAISCLWPYFYWELPCFFSVNYLRLSGLWFQLSTIHPPQKKYDGKYIYMCVCTHTRAHYLWSNQSVIESFNVLQLVWMDSLPWCREDGTRCDKWAVLGAARHNVQWNSGLAWSKFLAQRTVWRSNQIHRHSTRSIGLYLLV